jgi:hypothetical protein
MHVVTFYSTNVAMRAERVAKGAGCTVKLIPTPRHLSADCGTALRIESKDVAKIKKVYAENKVQYVEIAPLEPA